MAEKRVPKLGEWWFGVICKKCQNAILIFYDKSEGKRGLSFAGPGGLKVTCSRSDCQHPDSYGTDELRCFQVGHTD